MSASLGNRKGVITIAGKTPSVGGAANLRPKGGTRMGGVRLGIIVAQATKSQNKNNGRVGEYDIALSTTPGGGGKRGTRGPPGDGRSREIRMGDGGRIPRN